MLNFFDNQVCVYGRIIYINPPVFLLSSAFKTHTLSLLSMTFFLSLACFSQYVQRINMFKQLGCVTSIYDKRRDVNMTGTMDCDIEKGKGLSFRSLVRNEEKIDKSFPGVIELMQVSLCLCLYVYIIPPPSPIQTHSSNEHCVL